MEAISGIGISINYGKKQIVNNQNINLTKGKITGLIGPNGSGKSTIIKALSGVIPFSNGEVLIDGKPISHMKSKERAQKVAYLAQTPVVPDDLTVQNLVKLGRYAFGKGIFGHDEREKEEVQRAMVQAKVADLANQRIDSLSGGQRQRAYIAMTLAHDSDTIILDEPTTYLDLTHQLDVLDLMKQLNQQQNKSIGIVLHDLNQAAQYCDRLICIQNGLVVTEGTAMEVLTPELLAEVFEIKADIILDKIGRPQLMNYETLVQS